MRCAMNKCGLSFAVLLSACSTQQYSASTPPPAVPDILDCRSAITESTPDVFLPDITISGTLDAWVLVSYELDGSGVAINSRVQSSDPPGVFDEGPLKKLEQTKFVLGKRAQCQALFQYWLNCPRRRCRLE